MQCPICSAEAQNRTPATLPGIVLACGSCGEYRIAGAAYEHLAKLSSDRRALALDHAKRASKHGLPMIDLAAVSPL
jgi:ribosomal protein L37AE/L43A